MDYINDLAVFVLVLFVAILAMVVLLVIFGLD